VPASRRAWEDLVQRAQDKRDRATEVVARSMLARCLLRMQQRDEARHELSLAARVVDPVHGPAMARYRGALARLAVEEGPARRGPSGAARLPALGRGVPHRRAAARRREPAERRARAAGARRRPRARPRARSRARPRGRPRGDVRGVGLRPRRHRRHRARPDRVDRGADPPPGPGARPPRGRVRLGRWGRRVPPRGLAPRPHAARRCAVGVPSGARGCEDLVALVLGDLSLVYEAAGDVVEARRLVLRALRTGREHHLASAWPERWAGLHAQARRLEVE
jgi:hypothetical protein